MKVKDLKEKLNQCDDNMEVVVTSDNYELKNNLVSARTAIIRKMKTISERFKDDFDYEYYFCDVYKYSDDGEDVLIIID